MSRLIGFPYNGGGLIAKEAHSSVATTSAIPRVIGGTNRLYYEMVTGQVIEGSPQCSPRRPCGGAGHDHTGGYMGKALVHTVFAACYPDDNLDGRTVPPTLARSGSGSAPYPTTTANYAVPIPACEASGAYTKLSVRIVAEVTAYSASTALEGFVYSSATGFSTGVAYSASISGAGFITAAVNVPFLPGQFNKVRITMGIEEYVDTTIELRAVSISQVS